MGEPKELVLLSKAQRAIAQAGSVDEVKELRDKAAAVRAYAQKARLGKHLVIEAAAVRIRAERRLGQMLGETELADSAPGNQYTDPAQHPASAAVLLDDLGITKNESSRSQRIAQLPDDSFEQYLAGCVETGREPTFAGLLRLLRAADASSTEPNSDRAGADHHDARSSRPTIDVDFSTLLAVPPWPGFQSPGQPPITTDALCDLPMARQGHEHAHLYLWTSSRLLVDGLDVMEAWGFTYHASFVVVYEDERQGTPWGDTHRLLLAGARGGRRYGQCHSRSWLHHPRPGDNFVPPEIIEMIEAISPGPYVLLSAAQESPGEEWTCFPFESAA